MKKKEILYIEDEPYSMEYRIKMLKDKGYNVEIAEEVDSALKKLKQKYDLILLDIMMPSGNLPENEVKGGYETGVALIKKIKESTNKNTPILVITANPSSQLRTKIEKIGVASYLTKPLHQIEFEEEIERILGENSNE